MKMEDLTRQCLEDGCVRLIDRHRSAICAGTVASFDETVRMLKIVKEYDGIFASHTRNYDAEGKPDRMGGYQDMLKQAMAAGVAGQCIACSYAGNGRR